MKLKNRRIIFGTTSIQYNDAAADSFLEKTILIFLWEDGSLKAIKYMKNEH